MVTRETNQPRGRLIRMLGREIWKTRTRFSSIFLMVLISAAMFAGIYAITPTMQTNVDQMFQEQSLYDIALIKQSGWNESDEKLFQDIPLEIERVERRYTKDVVTQVKDTSFVTRVISQEQASIPTPLTGHVIQNSQQCLVDESGFAQVGDTLTMLDENRTFECDVVGSVRLSEYFSKENKGETYLRSGQIEANVIVAADYFTTLPSEMLIRLRSPEQLSTFSSAYQDKVEHTLEVIRQKIPNSEVQMKTRLDIDSVRSYKEDSEKINQIGTIFPVIFIVVSMLVVLTTMTRMIEDDRSLIGTLKSLGYKKRVLLLYYQGYIAIPTFLGCVFGIVFGIYLFPTIVMQSYQALYTVVNVQPVSIMSVNAMAVLLMMGLLLFVTTLTVFGTLKEKPATLLRPKAPVAGKKIFLEYIPFLWNRLKFVDKVTFRNIFRYKKRLFMSLFGIAGSTAILLTALGLYTSITPTVEKQFEDVQLYDYTLFPKGQKEDLYQDRLQTVTGVKATTGFWQQTVQLKTEQKEDVVTLRVPTKSTEIQQMMNFVDAKQFYTVPNIKLEFNQNSVLISQKAARLFDIEVGDIVELSSPHRYSFTVTGIFENYFGNTMYIAPEIYEQVTGDDVEWNSMFVQRQEKSEDQTVIDQLLQFDPTLTIVNNSANKAVAKQSIQSVNSIVLLMIGFAVLLIVIVIYNLNSINIVERTRELATIKVLGFYNREMVMYIFKESIITTMIASLFGLVAGVPIHLFIVMQSEIPSIQFIYPIPFFIYLITFFLTLMIAIATNLFMVRKIYKVDMISSLKSIE